MNDVTMVVFPELFFSFLSDLIEFLFFSSVDIWRSRFSFSSNYRLVFEIIVMFIHWIIIIIIPILICVVIVIQRQLIMNKQQLQHVSQPIHRVHCSIIQIIDQRNDKIMRNLLNVMFFHGKTWRSFFFLQHYVFLSPPFICQCYDFIIQPFETSIRQIRKLVLKTSFLVCSKWKIESEKKNLLFSFLQWIGKTTRFVRLGDQIKESIDAQSSTQLQFYIERSISVQFNLTAHRRSNFGKNVSLV